LGYRKTTLLSAASRRRGGEAFVCWLGLPVSFRAQQTKFPPLAKGSALSDFRAVCGAAWRRAAPAKCFFSLLSLFATTALLLALSIDLSGLSPGRSPFLEF
jgi:hypothetical protein